MELDTLNKYMLHPEDYMKETDENYQNQLEKIARDIYDNRFEKPIILLSGPSGSGKTTTAQKIEAYLDSWGVETHTMSMDNWFRSLTEEEKELKKQGLMDLESPNQVDHELLTKHLMQMIRMEEVQLPTFDFLTSSRVKETRPFVRKPGELIIMEGIHTLNPDVVSLPKERTWRIYVSVESSYTYEGKTLEGPMIRLIRRMSRDQLHRGRTPEETNMMYDSVQNGEIRYIAPYKGTSDITLDSLMPYELCVYKDVLKELAESDDPRMEEIRWWLSKVEPLDRKYMTEQSLIWEFVSKE